MAAKICPRFDAATVCTSPMCPSLRIVSTIPSAVSGLTKHQAASSPVDLGLIITSGWEAINSSRGADGAPQPETHPETLGMSGMVRV
jgi:hypothetical protein